MTDRDALIAAVCDRPDDDTPRLAYADWLDDHGEGERAAFIRAEVKLDRDYPGWHDGGRGIGEPGYGEFWQLKRTVLRLRKRFKRIFPGPWSQVVFGTNLTWYTGLNVIGCTTRGFVERVVCPAADWLAHADAILAAHPVRAVTLTTMPRVEGNEQVGDDRWLRLAGLAGDRVSWHRIPWSVAHHDITAHLLAAEWPKITFTLPPARTHQYSHWGGDGAWEIEIRPRDVWFDGHRLPGVAEGRLTGAVSPLRLPPEPGSLIGPLTARARDGRVYYVTRAVVTAAHVQMGVHGADRVEVEAQTTGEFRDVTWEPAPAGSPFVALEPRA